MRRAGFGAPRSELEMRVHKGYEATIEELLDPASQDSVDEDLLYRYFPNYEGGMAPNQAQAQWVYPYGQHQETTGRENGFVLAPAICNW